MIKEESNCAILDADTQVHELYAPGGEAVPLIKTHFPDVVTEKGVSRELLTAKIMADPTVLPRIEKLVHPLVRKEQLAFVKKCREEGKEFAVLDVPLLLEAGMTGYVDTVVVCTCDLETRKKRVLERQGMDAAKFEKLTARQMKEEDKVSKADWVVRTEDMETARAKVKEVVKELRAKVQGGFKGIVDEDGYEKKFKTEE